MAAATDVETETIEHLDFDVPCTLVVVETYKGILGWFVQSVTHRCEKPAVALLRCKVCGSTGYVCADHRSAIASMPSVTCGAYETTAAGLALYEFVPIGRE